jgi:signal transduction histidine kinase
MPRDRADHALEVIERNAQAEAQLVDSLLDLSRIAAGKLQLDSERVDLPALLEAVVDSVRPASDFKSITLEITPPAGPVIVVGDSSRLQQIFSNLLNNAVKFTPDGGHILVRITHQDRTLRFKSLIMALASMLNSCHACSTAFDRQRARKPGPVEALVWVWRLSASWCMRTEVRPSRRVRVKETAAHSR